MLNNVTSEIAKRLKTARKAAGFKSATDFAAKIKTPLSTYSQYEAGKRSINAELIISYSLQLNVNPYWLLTGDGNPRIDEIHNENKILNQENFSISQGKDNSYKLINTDLLRKVLLSAETIFEDGSIKLSYSELINYCFDVYNIVSTLTADIKEKEKIINLTMSSLKRGAKTEMEANLNDKKVNTKISII